MDRAALPAPVVGDEAAPAGQQNNHNNNEPAPANDGKKWNHEDVALGNEEDVVDILLSMVIG